MSENNKLNGILTSVKNAAGQVSGMAANTAEGVKTTALKIKDDAVAKQTERKISLAEKKRLGDLKKYSPIFKEDVANGELLLERFIRIVNYDILYRAPAKRVKKNIRIKIRFICSAYRVG